MNRSESIAEIAAAMAKAQGEIVAAAKDRVNPHFKSSYATLASVWEACRAALSKAGIAVVQAPAVDGGSVAVTTTLMHASGEWLSSELRASSANATPQAIGSAITYLRRYGLAAMVGVAPDDDDDGNAGAGRDDQRDYDQRERPPTQQRSAPKSAPPNAPTPEEIEGVRAEIALAKTRDELQTKCLPDIRRIAGAQQDHALRVAFNERWNALKPPAPVQQGAA